MEFEHTKKIIVRGTNWIGDAVMSLPAIAALKKCFPHAQIDVAARRWSAPVYNYSPHTNKVIEIEKTSGFNCLGTLMKVSKKIRATDYNFAIIFPNSFESALLFKLAGVRELVGYNTDFRSVILTKAVDVPKDKKEKHEVFYYINLIEKSFAHRCKGLGRKPKITFSLPTTDLEEAKRKLTSLGWKGERPLIGINPGAAYGPAKCWPSPKYRELSESLVRMFPRGKIIVFGTDKERKTGEEICKSLGKQGFNICGQTTLAEAICIISLLDLMVTNDSGLMHVAAACNIALVALFGSTNPVTTGPFSEKAVVINHALPCSPCLSRQCKRDFICMQGITVEEVFEACQKILRC